MVLRHIWCSLPLDGPTSPNLLELHPDQLNNTSSPYWGAAPRNEIDYATPMPRLLEFQFALNPRGPVSTAALRIGCPSTANPILALGNGWNSIAFCGRSRVRSLLIVVVSAKNEVSITHFVLFRAGICNHGNLYPREEAESGILRPKAGQSGMKLKVLYEY